MRCQTRKFPGALDVNVRRHLGVQRAGRIIRNPGKVHDAVDAIEDALALVHAPDVALDNLQRRPS